MSIVSAVVVYICTWWLVLFMILPIGASAPEAPAAGHAPSAPARPRILWKFGLTTLVATIVWAIIWAVIESDLISFRRWVREG